MAVMIYFKSEPVSLENKLIHLENIQEIKVRFFFDKSVIADKISEYQVSERYKQY